MTCPADAPYFDGEKCGVDETACCHCRPYCYADDLNKKRQCSSTAPCATLCRNVVDENGCIDPYTCQETGFFPKCKTQCLREYYHCVDVNDDYASTETCSDDLVFNPDTLQCTKSESVQSPVRASWTCTRLAAAAPPASINSVLFILAIYIRGSLSKEKIQTKLIFTSHEMLCRYTGKRKEENMLRTRVLKPPLRMS
ncbi:uncharacterized protein LOC123516197 isoform X2 [Portunus trituberculatus]|uniref:uncharacterized protein LOC123516197 isoform X2 n=1 Tax=Portunus trituberculatus TaxID=210409 RepID=UPI001E1CC5A7|nr:uncharacterized protein LOC123516197 isoform X2 [Portunus trituberculatus]